MTAILLSLAFLGLTVAAGSVLPGLRIEASSEALSLADDPDQQIYDESRATFGNDEYVFVTLSRKDLFTPDGVATIDSLTRSLAEVEGIAGVLSPTEVPLFFSSNRKPNLIQLRLQGVKSLPKLTSPKVDLEKARQELTTSPVFAGNLVSVDGRAANTVATFTIDKTLVEVTKDYLTLRRRLEQAEGAEAAKIRERLKTVGPRYRELETRRKDRRIAVVKDIRAVADRLRSRGDELYASGIPIIVVDMVRYIEADMRIFGSLSLVFLALLLAIVFRKPRWVLAPILICAATAILVLAAFVLQDKRLTIVTANIPSLLVVIGLAHSIHIIVRERELLAEGREEGRLAETLRSIFVPCLYTALTTGVGFASLVVAGIRPVVDFGLYMALGVGLALLLSFTALPALLSLFPRLAGADGSSGRESDRLAAVALGAWRHRRVLVLVTLGLVVLSLIGVARIRVETRFIDYFRSSSPIHRSLTYIDQNLGGTTQLEVVLRAKKGFFQTPRGLEIATDVEDMVRKQGNVGTVNGLASLARLARKIVKEGGVPGMPDAFLLKAVLPALGRDQLAGYVTRDWSEVRIVARVRDTAADLDRNKLVGDIRAHVRTHESAGVEGHVTGVFVLYTNMLNSLTGSQYKTAGAVLLLIFLMMLGLFRDLRAAALCMVPNALPILFVMGLMGWLGIHLDMATVMIASISLGIAIDGTIHYTFRYREEVRKDGDAAAAVERAQRTIGRAIFLTTLSSIAGFWVLTFSNFKPNVYFGLFTGLAMVTALAGTLTLLPVGLRAFAPFVDRTRPGDETDGDETPDSDDTGGPAETDEPETSEAGADTETPGGPA